MCGRFFLDAQAGEIIEHYNAPPPDLFAPAPTDRKLGLKLAAEAETVEQALARRARGGKMPDTYVPSYLAKEKGSSGDRTQS